MLNQLRKPDGAAALDPTWRFMGSCKVAVRGSFKGSIGFRV